jgi:hypothetical protein
MGTMWTCLRLHLCGMLVLLASCSATHRNAHEGSDGHSVEEAYATAVNMLREYKYKQIRELEGNDDCSRGSRAST